MLMKSIPGYFAIISRIIINKFEVRYKLWNDQIMTSLVEYIFSALASSDLTLFFLIDSNFDFCHIKAVFLNRCAAAH